MEAKNYVCANKKSLVATSPEFESSLDLLSQLRDECEQEPSQKTPQIVVIRRGSPRWFTFLLIFLCISALAGCGILAHLYQESAQNSAREISSLEHQLMAREASFSRLSDAFAKVNLDYSFYNANAAIVTPNGDKYHRLGCSHLTKKKLIVIDMDLAPSTYEKCSDCFD